MSAYVIYDYVCMLIFGCFVVHLMLACLYANVSFTMFVLQWVTDQLDEPFGSSGSRHF